MTPEHYEPGTYTPYRFAPVLKAVLGKEQEQWLQESELKRKQQQEILEAIWGKGVEVPRYFSPSTASMCLRWVGFEVLKQYPPAPAQPESSLTMMIGSAAHYAILRMLERVIPGRQETSFTVEEDYISGRIDFLFRNPQSGRFQIIELKTVSDYFFRQIKRERLPADLRSTRDIYCPSPEHYNQVLLYMLAKRKQGVDVESADVVYINRNNGQMKDALVIWDARTEYDANELVRKIKEAKLCIDKGQLPEPSVESPHICAGFCPYRINCDHGQKFAAGKVRREQKKRPQGVYYMAREQREKQRRMMEEKGLSQPGLPGFETRPKPTARRSRKASERNPEKETIIYLGQPKELEGEGYKCGTCGKQMVSIPVSVGKKGEDGVAAVNLVVGCLHCHPDRQGFKGKIQSVCRPRVLGGIKKGRRRGVEND